MLISKKRKIKISVVKINEFEQNESDLIKKKRKT